MPPPNRTFQTLSRIVAMSALGFALSACAVVSQHPDGSASIAGLAAVSIHQTPGAPPGHVTVRSHGVTLSDKPPAQGLVVGVYDQQMQFGQPAPVVHYPAATHRAAHHGEIDFVGRTHAVMGEPVYDDYRPAKRKKYRKHRRCRCR
jgi:hypothetical protein